MHELSIAVSLVDAVLDEAARRGIARVDAVHLRIGPLAGVVHEALAHAFELAAGGTPLSASRLIVSEVPVLAECAACGGPRPVASLQHFVCAACGGPAGLVVQGRELEIVALEVPS